MLAAAHTREHYLEWQSSGGAAGLFEAFRVPRFAVFGFLPFPLAVTGLRFLAHGVRRDEPAPEAAAVIIAVTLVLLLALGVPLFVVIGTVAAMAFSLYAGHGGIDGLQVLIVKMTSLTSKNVFLAIPFFVVSGAIMSAGSIARRLVAVAEALVGGLRGRARGGGPAGQRDLRGAVGLLARSP